MISSLFHSVITDGTVRIANATNDAIPISVSQHFAQILRVMTPHPVVEPFPLIKFNPSKGEQFQHITTNFSSPISVDLDKV